MRKKTYTAIYLDGVTRETSRFMVQGASCHFANGATVARFLVDELERRKIYAREVRANLCMDAWVFDCHVRDACEDYWYPCAGMLLFQNDREATLIRNVKYAE